MSDLDSRQLQIYKLAEVGVMTAAVIHEVRQPLFAAKGFLQMVLFESHHKGIGVDARLPRVLELIEELESMISRFLDFSRNPGEQMMPMDLLAPVDGGVALLNNRLRKARIQVHIESPEAGLPMVRGNIMTLQQVVVNLLLNALDALSECDLEAGRHILIRFGVATGADSVHVDFADSGNGVSDLDRERIFDYFYTTKPIGMGTGMGLAISREIARMHGGDLTLESIDDAYKVRSPGARTLFRLTLPSIMTVQR